MTQNEKECIINMLDDLTSLWQALSREEQLLIVDLFKNKTLSEMLIFLELTKKDFNSLS